MKKVKRRFKEKLDLINTENYLKDYSINFNSNNILLFK